MNTKPTGVCTLNFVKEQEKEHEKLDKIKVLKDIIDINYIFTDHLFKESEIEIIRKNG